MFWCWSRCIAAANDATVAAAPYAGATEMKKDIRAAAWNGTNGSHQPASLTLPSMRSTTSSNRASLPPSAAAVNNEQPSSPLASINSATCTWSPGVLCCGTVWGYNTGALRRGRPPRFHVVETTGLVGASSRCGFGGIRPTSSLALTLLEPQSRLGDKALKLYVSCPRNGAAVLKGLTFPEADTFAHVG